VLFLDLIQLWKKDYLAESTKTNRKKRTSLVRLMRAMDPPDIFQISGGFPLAITHHYAH